jgi:predicted helicase
MPIPAALQRSISAYYASLHEYRLHRAHNEGATSYAFQTLLTDLGRPRGFSVLGQQSVQGTKGKPIRVDAKIVDQYNLTHGIWEAKDTYDDLDAEISKKIATGYPLTNIIFEDTRRAVLYQHGSVVFDDLLAEPANLQSLLDRFFSYTEPHIEEFHKAVVEFRQRIPDLAGGLTEIIEEARQSNAAFRAALNDFLTLCREALNPATTQEEVEDMLKQHILTERIFRVIFDNPDFVLRNAVAVELEKMVKALTSKSFSRDSFLKRLDFFYVAIERAAATIDSYEEKQSLLNTLYEQFFQAYSTRAADTHGIVYTPREIVAWMVNSVEKALQTEFGLSLASEGVHIIDPCVGTGTFVMELLRHIPTSALEQKFRSELHANEVLLLPYYIAAQNIEHAYYERTGSYLPFEGLCFADTLNMEKLQTSFFAPENSERIARQNAAPIRVVIGNPPYNVGQASESDNNKNRRYPLVDQRIRETYSKASQATNKNALGDMYVKFFRWATDRLGKRDGVVCFVSNNSFLEQIAFDGMRKYLLQDFTRIYTFDLGGNVRENPKLSGTRHNVFGIQVGVTMTILIRNSQHTTRDLFYARVDEFWTKEQKLLHLAELKDCYNVEWQLLTPNARNIWLTEGLHSDFDALIPLGSKEAKAMQGLDVPSIFSLYSSGVKTNRDQWAYAFTTDVLRQKVNRFIETYNSEVDRWKRRSSSSTSVDEFVNYDDETIKWSESLKANLVRGKYAAFDGSKLRQSLYRPFSKQFLFFDRILNERVYVFPSIFPIAETEKENSVIGISGIGSSKPFHCLITDTIAGLDLLEKTQCFPFYTYDEDGTKRRENITDWALQQFRTHYSDPSITKLDIFHYVYAVLHSHEYRTKYAANLKRDLPRIPFVPAESFRPYVQAGEQLATLHRDYETVQPYPLQRIENSDRPFSWRVDKMRLSQDHTSLQYNSSLILAGIPPEVFSYKLGNRSALEWVIDQFRVTEDARSGIKSDPNNPDDPQYILNLIGRVTTVSLQTVQIVNSFPPLTAPIETYQSA